MKEIYTVEKRTADEHFICTIPGIDFHIGELYFVLKLNNKIIAWAHTKERAIACKY